MPVELGRVETRRGSSTLVKFSIACLTIAAGSVVAEEREPVPTIWESQQLWVLQIGEKTTAIAKSTPANIAFKVEKEGKWTRLVAMTSEGAVHSDWQDSGKAASWIAFNADRNHFESLTNRIRVVLKDDARLRNLAERINATDTKNYPTAGYALLWLPLEKNPAEVVAALNAMPGVRKAEVVVAEPLLLPL